jgi:hypothetical protein
MIWNIIIGILYWWIFVSIFVLFSNVCSILITAKDRQLSQQRPEWEEERKTKTLQSQLD